MGGERERSEQVQLAGPQAGLDATIHTQLAIEMFEVGFDRIERDHQGTGNLLVRAPSSQQA